MSTLNALLLITLKRLAAIFVALLVLLALVALFCPASAVYLIAGKDLTTALEKRVKAWSA